MRRWLRGLPLLLLVAAGFGVRPAAAEPLSRLHALAAQGAAVSARVIDLRDGRTLAELHGGKALTPASVSKLYVAAAALRRWGADYRFKTRILRRGEISHGALHGDLILVGAGDPGFTNAQMWTLAQRVRASGISKIEGAIVVDQSLFGRVPCATTDRCSALKVSRDAYNAPLSSAGFDYNNACLRVSPGAHAGEPARLSVEPFDLPMFGIRGGVKTLSAGKGTSVGVLRRTDHARDWFYVSGGIAADAAPRCYYRSVSYPARYAGQALRAFLRESGVSVHDVGVRVESRAQSGGVPLAEVEGTPLGEQLRGMLIYSNNYMADLLALGLAGKDDAPPLTLQKAGVWLTQFARKTDADSPWHGARVGRPLLASGSGLTVDSRISADDLVALLSTVYDRYGDFPAFLGALTVPDQTPVAMLKGGSKAWETQVAAKTGSLSDPVSVFALAGYLRLPDGDWGAFAVLINGTKRYPHIGLDRTVHAVRGDLEAILQETGHGAVAGQARLRAAGGG